MGKFLSTTEWAKGIFLYLLVGCCMPLPYRFTGRIDLLYKIPIDTVFVLCSFFTPFYSDLGFFREKFPADVERVAVFPTAEIMVLIVIKIGFSS